MKKMPCVFVRDFSSRPATTTREVTPGCEWVLAGEGEPTRKWDGTCCLVRDGKIYARYDCKRGKTPPEGFEPCQPEADPVTGHWPGWLLVEGQPQYKWHAEAFKLETLCAPILEGTYELCGPKVNANPEGLKNEHRLIRHGAFRLGYRTVVIDPEGKRPGGGVGLRKRRFLVRDAQSFDLLVGFAPCGGSLKLLRAARRCPVIFVPCTCRSFWPGRGNPDAAARKMLNSLGVNFRVDDGIFITTPEKKGCTKR